jgi:hypothetical protein
LQSKIEAEKTFEINYHLEIEFDVVVVDGLDLPLSATLRKSDRGCSAQNFAAQPLFLD